MGSLIKEKGHELLSFDYDNIMADIYGDASLASRNLNPDPLFRIVRENGRMKYFAMGRPPRPDGWGVFAKGPTNSDRFSEQNGFPLPLGDSPYYDLDHTLVNGAPLPEARDYVDIAQPEAPRAVIFVTGEKAYPTGWYCAAHAWRMKDPARTTTPDPDTAGFPGTRTEAFQMSGSLGKAFYIPQPPKNAYEIVFYLTNAQTSSSNALSAQLYEQFTIIVDDNPDDTVEFRGPLKLSKKAPRTNKTKLESWGTINGFNIDKTRNKKDNDAFDVQFAYDLVDYTGHSIGTTSKIKHMGKDSHKNYRFKPVGENIDKVVKNSIKGWRAFVRYRKKNEWGKWQSLRRKGDDIFRLDQWAEVYGPDGYRKNPWGLAKGEPSKKDTTGIPNPTEPMTAVDATISLNNNGLINGKHRIKVVLYDGDEPSEPSPATVLDITASNQVPRIYQPFFTNSLDNPEMIDTSGTTSRPRDWTFNRDARNTYERGKLTANEKDGQNTRGDLIITPYGYIGTSELRYNGRVIVEVAEHVGGKAIDILMEYHVNSYSATGVPNVTFIKQSTLGVHRKNGRYQLGFRTNKTRARDSIPLDPTTNLVVIKTISDGTDPNLGVRDYITIRKGHGIFQTTTPNKRKTADYLDKVDWWEPEEESYPHGGYCKVITSGEDSTLQGVTMNMNDTGIDIPNNDAINVDSHSRRTHEVRFRTGDDISTIQAVYREGDGTNGYAFYVQSGQLKFRAWSGTGNVASVDVDIHKNTVYMASMVRDSDGITCYLDGESVGTGSATLSPNVSGGSNSAGYNTGTIRSSTSTTITTARPLLGRIYELRLWLGIKSASFIADNWDKPVTYEVVENPVTSEELYPSGTLFPSDTLFLSDTTPTEDMGLYYLVSEMEGTKTYDRTGHGSHGTIVGNFRWINEDLNAAWRYDADVIDRLNFRDNIVPSPWSMNGAATSTVGDFSASRFSEYGMRITGTGTNLRYASRTLPGGYTTFAMGAQKRFITLPVGSEVTLLQARDSGSAVMEIRLTPAGRLQYRANGTTAWTAFVDGIEPGERMYFEVRGENFGTANGIMRLFVGATHEEELQQVGMLTGLNWTDKDVTSVRVGALETTTSVSNNWDFHMGEVILSENGMSKKHYLPGNYIEYYGPEGTPPNEEYGMHGLAVPVTPGTQMTHSIYAWGSGLIKAEDQALGATFYDENDEEVDEINYLVNFDDIESEWKRHSRTFTVPDDAAYMVYDRNNIGQGTYRLQALQIERNNSPSIFTARRNTTGYIRVKFDSITPGCDMGSPADAVGAAIDLLRMGYVGSEEDTSTVTLEIASSATKNGTYSPYFTDIADVPRNRWYEIKVTLTTTDPDESPVIKGLYLNVKRPYPMLLKPNGEEYLGGTLINNMSPPIDRRLVEVHQMDDGSGGFTTWGNSKPTAWIEPFEMNVFRESTLDEISNNIGKDDSTFMIEYNDEIYEVRIIEPLEVDVRRASHVSLGGEEDEDFYRFVVTMPRAEVLQIQDV